MEVVRDILKLSFLCIVTFAEQDLHNYVSEKKLFFSLNEHELI